ncbi:hypothetical protein Cob_v003703 [Colletotrichum orbiculare MAFF 240422]|uniref:DUF7514 domain-containing protein n=1 Tax=Colletotrichum orbiculare (strain 104-T / ATCC 96160 / CBS 514.97 / LARS 414 / MAFF 240422) TaxID=1213857 RepID=A0A484G024_COLOR|nr:hypothetical protein Cob_v003703 [Colletotrichum orbiculare MAFF 240422]
MTTAAAGKATRPKLDTNTSWNLPRRPPTEPEEDGELSPLSPGREPAEGDWDQKGARGLAEEKLGSANVSSSFLPRTRDIMDSIPPEMTAEKVRQIFYEEFAKTSRNGEAGTPVEAPRFSPLSSPNSVFTPTTCPSPPVPILDLNNNNNNNNNNLFSSSRKQSPKIPQATAATPPPAYVSPTVSTPPICPQPRAVHFRNRGPPVIHCQPRVDEEGMSPTAEAPPRVELSSVDKAWGLLFDAEGYPTQRLNSVLRGLANYLIADVAPHDSIVVTPEKMLFLYSKYKVDSERFRYQDVFRTRSKDSLETIQTLYDVLQCQYHLTQSGPHSPHDVPSLTAAGFSQWMIGNILAHPDLEARRLHQIMASLPVNADGPLVDGKAERLPKQLSRHLFPEFHDRKARQLLDETVDEYFEDQDAAPRSLSRSRSHNSRAPEANMHSRRVDDRNKRPVLPPLPHRSRTYDRGDRGTARVDSHAGRFARHNSDSGPGARHRDLPPPPVGRHSAPHHRQRSPAPTNRFSASLPAIHKTESPSPAAQLAADVRGGDANYGVYSGRERDRERSGGRDEAPRSPGLGGGRRGERVPTWEDVYSRAGTRGSLDSGARGYR